MMRYLVLILILSISLPPAFAQSLREAKIITLENDTISGYIEKVSSKPDLTAIEFRINKKSGKQYLSADTLKGFIAEDGIFYSVDTEADKVKRFLRLMVDGSTQMFSKLNEYREYDYYFKKTGEKAEKYNDESPWHFLSSFFYDCNGLIFRSRKKIYTRNELIDIVNQYNNCDNKYSGRTSRMLKSDMITLLWQKNPIYSCYFFTAYN